MTNFIPVSQHPSNLDRTAKLVNGPAYRERDIYQVRGGYLAMMGHGFCLEGLFPSQHDAEVAQTNALFEHCWNQ